MTPLIDCIFLLLIFLMCVTEITKTENDQNLILPFAQTAIEDKEGGEGRVVINVYPAKSILTQMWQKELALPPDAVVTIGGKPMTWGDVQNHLELVAKTAEKTQGGAMVGNRELVELPVKIRGHRTAPFMFVQFAMVYCIDMAYWKISFGTYNKEDFTLPNPLVTYYPEQGSSQGERWQPSTLIRVLN